MNSVALNKPIEMNKQNFRLVALRKIARMSFWFSIKFYLSHMSVVSRTSQIKNSRTLLDL